MTISTQPPQIDEAPGPPRRRLRIAQVTATFPPYLGGTGNVCYHNALQLARRGHEVHVFTAARPLDAHRDPPELTVHRLQPLVSIGNAPLLLDLPAALRGFDIVHLHYPYYFGAELAVLACKRYHTPYVVTYHQDVELLGWLRPVPLLHRILVGTRVLAGAARLLFTSTDYGRVSQYARLVASGQVSCGELPNGVDIEQFQPQRVALHRRSGLGITPPPTLLFVGSLDQAHYFKGVVVLLEAMRRLNEPGVRLDVVGDGDLRPAYERQAAQLGLTERVSFCGRVADAELPDYYAEADVVVLPSTTRGEAFGMVLLEAMACGTPVVASNLPGVRTVVRDGETGLLAEPGDPVDLAEKLDRLLADPALRARMGEAGRRRVETHYDWRAIGERLETLYVEVLKEGASQAGARTRA